MKEQGHVLVIGAANLDVKGRPNIAPTRGSSIPGVIRSSLGGVARNIAENLARLDVDTVLLTSVGDDDAGVRILGQAAGNGIDISEALIIEDQRTGAYMALLTEDGELDIALDDMGILATLTPGYFEERHQLFRDARMVAIDANLTPEALETVFRLCQEEQIPVCADPTSNLLASRLCPHLPQLYMTCPNVPEARSICGDVFAESDREAAQVAAAHLVSLGVDVAIITLGEHGVVYADAETKGHIPAIQTQIVDSIGAGDAQTAAIIFGLLEGFPLDECIRLGVTAATLTLRTRESVRPDLSIELLYDELVI